MAVPIWKDYFITASGSTYSGLTYLDYRIKVSSSVIYQGRTFKRPGESSFSIKMNDICADYLENVLPTLSQAEFTALSMPVTFSVEAYVSSSWTSIGSVQFIGDWSYDYDYDPAVNGMSFPVNGHIDGRMPLVWTGLNVSTIQIQVVQTNGTTSNVYIPIAITNDFNVDYNSDFARSVRSAGSGTAVFYPSAWSNVAKIIIQGNTFEVVTDCARYALYYVNAYGGWDCLLIEGNTLEADNLTRYLRNAEYDNRNIQNRGIYNYVNEIAKTFTFHTGLLKDDQGCRMHHLLNSTDVYLYDIANDDMIPVIVTGNVTEYKTYRNQGNKMAQYTFQVQVAQNRIRR